MKDRPETIFADGKIRDRRKIHGEIRAKCCSSPGQRLSHSHSLPSERMIRLLRPHRLTPAELKSRLDAGEKLGVIDLLRFEDDPHGVPGIPGAVRLDPPEIRRKKHIIVPPDVGVVIYCHSKNSFVSARVAAAMRKHGIQRVQDWKAA
jgi:rhodanese-related sulfurtransferase